MTLGAVASPTPHGPAPGVGNTLIPIGGESATLTGRRLPRSFYARPVVTVARDCVGKVLIRASVEGTTAGRIVEAEAYRGPDDRAAHSWGGRHTPRTRVMFGPAGYAYIFLVYGMHWHFNLVTGDPGAPEAVLVRAVEPIAGTELMARRRGVPAERRELTNGPGKLCAAFGITGADYGADLCNSHEIYLCDGPPPRRVRRSQRIGIDYAGEWALRPWRFFDGGSRHVSPVRPTRRSS